MASDRVIWKFEMPGPQATITMPAGARIVAVAEQFGAMVFWAECDPTEGRVDRTFRAAATGEVFPEGLTYRGTALFKGGALVWHLLEDA
jgi:hypothetical protein